MTVTMGSPAIYRASPAGSGYTYLDRNGAANETGTITSFQFYFLTAATGVVVGAVTKLSYYAYNPRNSVTIGNVSSGSTQTFSGLNCPVVVGDNIAYYCASGALAYDAAGWNIFYQTGNQVASYCVYNESTAVTLSMYGFGLPPGWTGKICGVTNLGKINGIAKTNFNKVMGV